MNEELLELMMSGAMELMEPTRMRLREKNSALLDCQKECGKLEIKFDAAISALRNVNSDMADLFVEHYNAYEHLGYQTELFAYVQGYIDCMQLLTGLGLLQGVNQKWIERFLKQYSMDQKKKEEENR